MKANKIIIIMTDTQRQDMLGCYGNDHAYTPNIDRLADEGMRFEKSYCTQPLCGPARSSIFTGTFPHTNGVVSNSVPMGSLTKTIGQRMSSNGYSTAYIGKWHLDAGDYFGDGICPDGWDKDYWYDMRNYLEELTPEERVKSRQWQAVLDDEVDSAFTFAHRCSNRAIDYLENHQEEDFLLVVSYDEPHHPWLCPKEFYDRFEAYEWPKSPNVFDDLADKPEHQKLWAKWANNGDYLSDRDNAKVASTLPLLACNSYVDSEIGRVLDAVKKYASDAMIVYTADHGSAIQSHCLRDKGAAMYDEITRIPFIVKWPETVEQKSVNSQVVSHVDIVPTLMEAAGMDLPESLQGKSLLPTFINKNDPVNEAIHMEYTRYEIDHDSFGGFQPIRCIFDGRYKLVINLMTTDELYDLESDPYEMKNLINETDSAKIRNDLHDQLLGHMNNSRDIYRGYYWERRPWRQDARDADWEYTGMTRQRVTEADEVKQLDYMTGLEIEDYVRIKDDK